MHFLVTEFGFAKNFRLQLELHELLHAPALHQDLRPFLIDRDAQFILLRKENCVRLGGKFVAELFEQLAQLSHLLVCKRVSV